MTINYFLKIIKTFLIEGKMSEVKNKLIDVSLPIFAEYERDRRNFFTVIATISATIGAFSFLLFPLTNIVKNLLLLKIGDGLLLLTIIFSVSTYLFILRDSQNKFHKVYYDYLEIFNNKDYEKIPKYKRPETREYGLELIVCSIFILALVFIGISFI